MVIDPRRVLVAESVVRVSAGTRTSITVSEGDQLQPKLTSSSRCAASQRSRLFVYRLRGSVAPRSHCKGVSTSSDYVRVMDQRLCQWLLCQANSYPVQ